MSLSKVPDDFNLSSHQTYQWGEKYWVGRVATWGCFQLRWEMIGPCHSFHALRYTKHTHSHSHWGTRFLIYFVNCWKCGTRVAKKKFTCFFKMRWGKRMSENFVSPGGSRKRHPRTRTSRQALLLVAKLNCRRQCSRHRRSGRSRLHPRSHAPNAADRAVAH